VIVVRLGRRALTLAFLSLALRAIATSSTPISLGTYSSVVGSVAGSSSDIVVSATSWSAHTGASWIHFTNASAAGSRLATFNYDANAGATRIRTVTVSNGGSTAILTLTQAGANFTASTRITTLVPNVGPAAGSSNFILGTAPLGANLSWGAATTASWIHLTTTHGTGSAVVPFTYDANAAATRTGTISFDAGALVFTLTQAGASYAAGGALASYPIGVTMPAGVATDSSGNVYLCGNGQLVEWNPSTHQSTPLSRA
jgi:hypothetical protein